MVVVGNGGVGGSSRGANCGGGGTSSVKIYHPSNFFLRLQIPIVDTCHHPKGACIMALFEWQSSKSISLCIMLLAFPKKSVCCYSSPCGSPKSAGDG